MPTETPDASPPETPAGCPDSSTIQLIRPLLATACRVLAKDGPEDRELRYLADRLWTHDPDPWLQSRKKWMAAALLHREFFTYAERCCRHVERVWPGRRLLSMNALRDALAKVQPSRKASVPMPPEPFPGMSLPERR